MSILDKIIPPTFTSFDTDESGVVWGVRTLGDGTEKRVKVEDPSFVHESRSAEQIREEGCAHEKVAAEARDAIRLNRDMPDEEKAVHEATNTTHRRLAAASFGDADMLGSLRIASIGSGAVVLAGVAALVIGALA